MIDSSFWNGKSVFLTGHTGFKGAWMTLWLTQMGAKVTGYSNGMDKNHKLYSGLEFDADRHVSIENNINDAAAVAEAIQQSQPDIVIHFAAQSLVRQSYKDPIENFETNVMGTCNVLNALRETPSAKICLIVTSDKCYKNNETGRYFKESDAMGGDDPYSASKACAEIVTHSFRHSFFKGEKSVKIASARAGNVIGGGDFSEDRLIPDMVRAAHTDEAFVIRSPEAVRPWQHVLECLSGYLLLCRNLWQQENGYDEAWNFGPDKDSCKTVEDLVEEFQTHWSDIKVEMNKAEIPHEAKLLNLDTRKAEENLNWSRTLDFSTAVQWTAQWYKDVVQNNGDVTEVSKAQLNDYIALMNKS